MFESDDIRTCYQVWVLQSTGPYVETIQEIDPKSMGGAGAVAWRGLKILMLWLS